MTKQTNFTVKSWDDDLIVNGETFTYDPRMNEHLDYLGMRSMKRYCKELGLKFLKVRCLDLRKHKFYIFTN